MAEFGVSASIGAQCEMSMDAVGFPVIGRLMAAGIRPSLSGDTETCGTGDMFTQMRDPSSAGALAQSAQNYGCNK